MTATQTTLIWLNLVGAFAAMLTNARAATPHPRDRFEFGMAATLATLFAVAMVVQLVTDTDSIGRSLPRLVGVVAWPLVWCWPAVVTVRKQRHK